MLQVTITTRHNPNIHSHVCLFFARILITILSYCISQTNIKISADTIMPILSKPRVTFSQHIELAIVPQESTELTKSKWYSQEDNTTFRTRTSNDIRRLRNELATAASDNFNEDCSCEYVGIETLLSRPLMMLVAEKMHEHINAILSEQHRYRSQHDNVEEESLAEVSERSSRWARQRANQRARSN